MNKIMLPTIYIIPVGVDKGFLKKTSPDINNATNATEDNIIGIIEAMAPLLVFIV